MDPLTEVLRAVHLEGTVLFRVQARAPWAVKAPPMATLAAELPWVSDGQDLVMFHIVEEGELHAGLPGHDALHLRAGDLVVIVRGQGHVLADHPDTPPVDGTALLPDPGAAGVAPAIELGGDGAAARIVCGNFLFDRDGFNPILPALPDVFRIRASEGPPAPWFERTLSYVIREAESAGPGSGATLACLAELLFVEMVRVWVQRLPEGQTGWLAALRDPVVGRALEAIHGDPAAEWTVGGLARQAGISRSGLAERFATLVGEPPVQYLTRWRMQLAARLLREEDDSMASVAEQVGYASVPGFSRAFKRTFGEPPATWRDQQA